MYSKALSNENKLLNKTDKKGQAGQLIYNLTFGLPRKFVKELASLMISGSESYIVSLFYMLR